MMKNNDDSLLHLIGNVQKKPSTSTADFLGLMLRILRKHLGMEVAFISQINSGRRTMLVIESEIDHPALRAGHSDPLNETYCQLIIQGKIPQVITDARKVAEVSHISATEELPVGAHISVPLLLDDGSVYGTLCCFSSRPDESLTSRDLNLLQAFSEVAKEHISEELKANNTATFLRQRFSRLLAEKKFHTVYQPIINLAQMRIIGYEALSRFDLDPVRSPDKWFAEAKSIGMDVDLEIACIESAVQVMTVMEHDCYLSINVSPELLMTQEFDELIIKTPLNRLVIEVTEHVIVDCYVNLVEKITALRKHGARLAVDDAGAGYSSFKHILALKPDIIKLDMSLVRDIDTDFHRNSLARGLMSFATAIGCKVIAEGVETEQELNALRVIGVNKAQGYLLGKPARKEHIMRSCR
jgi:EAL domain-containing protein (putative c-di-GMP-specific phosphodiesterase class I)